MNNTRKSRLASDYREIMSMTGPVLSVKPLSGIPPYVDEYELTIRLRSIVGPEPTYRNEHVVRVSLPSGYPIDDYPRAVMVTRPYPYHTNWFSSGRWCYGASSHCTEGLGNFIVRLMQSLQFDPYLIDTTSCANDDAARWYIQNKKIAGMFPCDKTKLPQPGVMVIKKINK